MIAYIKGILIQSSPISLVIETGGLGYKLFIPPSLFSQLPQIGNSICLHTSFVCRELSQTLYGFFSINERDLFESFMNVTGIGPKLALSLIGHLSLSSLHHAIINNDLTTMCKVPGVGKKTAERLVIELRDKITHFLPSSASEYTIDAPENLETRTINDAMSAMINLGYNQQTAQKAIKKALKELPENTLDLANLITGALKNT